MSYNCTDLEKFDVIIDVRTPQENSQVRIDGSELKPMGDIEEWAQTLREDAIIGVYCRSGARSGSVCQYLIEEGFNVTNLGGIAQFMGCLEY